MTEKKFNYIYGPVFSWRLGRSLGIDLISRPEKECSFDCVYCQVGRRPPAVLRRKVFVPTSAVIAELKKLPKRKIDYITFSGTGEPALAANLGQTIRAVKKLRKEPVALITNGSLLYRRDVRREARSADLVMVKLDAGTQNVMKKVNNPRQGLGLEKIVRGIFDFRKIYRGTFTLQMMFVAANRDEAPRMLDLAKRLSPDVIYLNTPLRPCGCKALSPRELARIKKVFSGLPVVTVFESERRKIRPIDRSTTRKRRGE